MWTRRYCLDQAIVCAHTGHDVTGDGVWCNVADSADRPLACSALQSSAGYTPLMVAAAACRLDCVRTLMGDGKSNTATSAARKACYFIL